MNGVSESAAITDYSVSEELKTRIKQIESLPTLPEIYNQLISELSATDVSMKRVASIVAGDVAISAKLLQVVNSAYFAVATEIQSVQQAVSFLGIETVKGVVLSAGVYTGVECAAITGYTPTDLYRHGVAVGPKARFIAYCLGLNRIDVDSALTAGLLHDVGKLVLLCGFADEFREACAQSRSEQIPLHLAQENVIGANDAAIGGLLLTSWGLPQTIIEAVAMHYQPSQCTTPTLDATAAVHLAYASDYNQQHNPVDLRDSAFDLNYTNRLGITNQLSQFEGLTVEALANQN